MTAGDRWARHDETPGHFGPVPSPLEQAWADHRRIWSGPLDPRITFGAGFAAGYRAALERDVPRLRIVMPEGFVLDDLGARLVEYEPMLELPPEPIEGAVLTPDDIDVVAPALLEAGTRHLERGTAWHELGRRLHAIAERLYSATNRQETRP
jgi:hypothetical protein